MALPTKEAVLDSIPTVSKLPAHLRELAEEYRTTWDGARKYAFCEDFLTKYQEYHKKLAGSAIPSTRTQYVLAKLLGGYSGPDFNYLMTTGRQLHRKDVNPEVRKRMWGLLDDGHKRVSNVYQVIREANRARKVSERSLSEEIMNVLEKETERHGLWSKKLKFDLEVDAVDHAVNTVNNKKKEAKEALNKGRKKNGRSRERKEAPSAEREQLKTLRAAFDSYLDMVLNDRVPSELDRADLRQTYQDDFKLLIARFKRAADHRSDGITIDFSGGVDEAQVAEACEILEIDMPEFGTGFDKAAMTVAKAKFRRKALETHPDHGGNEDQFNAVTTAFNQIQELHKAEWQRA